jgi:anthranilate phosphoribosyltransferase
MGEMMDGTATPAQIAALAVALRMRGETAGEVGGFALAMRRRGVRIRARHRIVADTCGTGGDGLRTLNISTGAALVLGACGVAVAKHGNRAVSSSAGSADVFAALGVKVDAEPAVVEKCLNDLGIAFCFAPVFHPAMRNAGGPRKEMVIYKIFNLLGPLTNPAGANVQVIGVARRELLELEAEALARLGTGRSMVVHSDDGLDELTTTGKTRVIEVTGHRRRRQVTLSASRCGFRRASIRDLAGGTAEENAAALLKVLKGRKGAYRDVIVYNAGVMLWLAGRARNTMEGVEAASRALDNGSALRTLERLAEASNS